VRRDLAQIGFQERKPLFAGLQNGLYVDTAQFAPCQDKFLYRRAVQQVLIPFSGIG
jgi:hypothetical protein